VATPTISPNGGVFSNSVSVSLQSATSGSAIYYTMDGSAPTQSSTLYTGAMILASDATIKAAASDYTPSAVATATFTSALTSTTGNAYFVAKSGSDSNSCSTAAQGGMDSTKAKLTVTAGVACLSAGDTLYIKAGTYSEPNNAAILPTASNWAAATKISNFGNDVVIFSKTNPLRMFNTSAAYVIFNGLIFDGIGIAVGQGGHHFRFTNIEIRNFPGIAFNTSDPSYGGGVELIDSSIHDNGTTTNDNCVYLQTPNSLIDGNLIYNCQGAGIQLYSGDTSNSIIRNNMVHDTTLADNDLGMPDNRIQGIVIATGANIQVYRNIVYHLRKKNTAICPCIMGGIFVYTATDVTIWNNTVYDTAAYGLALDSQAGTVIARNNILYGSDAGTIYNGAGSKLTDDHNLTINPNFVDPANANFSLQMNSAAIDSGTATISTSPNITVSFYGAAPDIGAIEWSN
jgi:parallel beta-helix repeat protein